MKSFFNKNKIFGLVMFIITVFSLALSGFLYYKLNIVNDVKNSKNNTEIQNIINNVSKLYLIPTGEEPTVATVSDPQILKNQSFFLLSEKGDKVLIFNKAGKAILYRPSIDKIIEVAPIKNSIVSGDKQELVQ